MITIEPFKYSDSEYSMLSALDAAVFLGPPVPIVEWQHEDKMRDKAYPFYRDWVLRDGDVIGYVETFQSQFAYHPEKYEFRAFIDPEKDSADIRPIILAYTLERLKDKPLIALKSGMLDNRPEAMRFFADYGFEKVTVEKLSKLRVDQFDAERYADVIAAVHAKGIEIVSVRELQAQDPAWREKLYELSITVSRDIPATGEKHHPAFAEWCKKWLDAPTFDPNAWFVAIKEGHYLAQSLGTFNRAGEQAEFNTGSTGVRREWRRNGLATALKVRIIEHVKAEGVAEIFTSNDASNPMYQLNLDLGFEPEPSWVRVEKRLDAPSE